MFDRIIGLLLLTLTQSALHKSHASHRERGPLTERHWPLKDLTE